MEDGEYWIEVIAPLAHFDERWKYQLASFVARLGKSGRFYVWKGAAGGKSVSLKSVKVHSKVKRYDQFN